MSLFNVIEVAFLMIVLSLFAFVLEPGSPLPVWLNYLLLIIIGTGLNLLLIKAKNKWTWMNKKIDGQLAVFLIIILFGSPLLVQLILFGVGK